MRSQSDRTCLVRGEVLKYEEHLIAQPVFTQDMQPAGWLYHNDLVVVVGDEDKPMIQIMMPDLRRVWTRFVQNRLVKVGGTR